MGQTPEGAKKAAKKMLKKDPDYYRKIGAMGGVAGKTGRFSTLPKKELKRLASEGGKARARKYKVDNG